jgi:hypothetical protein
MLIFQDIRGMKKKQHGKGWKESEKAYTVDTLNTQGVLVSPNSTATPPTYSDTIIQKQPIMGILQKLTGQQYPTLTCSSAEALASLSQSLESAKDSPEQAACFGSTSAASKKKSLNISFGRMLKECLAQTVGETSPSFSLRFPKLGMLCGGKFSTPRTSVCLRTGNACLSSVLETEVPEKYFLSDKVAQVILTAVSSRVQSLPDTQHHSAKAHILKKRGTEQERLMRLAKGQNQANRVYDKAGLSPTVPTAGGGQTHP